MRILWDTDKATVNEQKHGMTFEEAAEALFMDKATAQSNANGECRFRSTVRIRGEYLTVIYARHEDNVRIISARHASEKEKRFYGHYFD